MKPLWSKLLSNIWTAKVNLVNWGYYSLCIFWMEVTMVFKCLILFGYFHFNPIFSVILHPWDLLFWSSFHFDFVWKNFLFFFMPIYCLFQTLNTKRGWMISIFLVSHISVHAPQAAKKVLRALTTAHWTMTNFEIWKRCMEYDEFWMKKDE